MACCLCRVPSRALMLAAADMLSLRHGVRVPVVLRNPRSRTSSLVLTLLPLAALAAFLVEGFGFVACPGAPRLGGAMVARRQVPIGDLQGRLALSARGGAEEEDDEDEEYVFQPALPMGELAQGQAFQGVVTRILPFGAFVDFGWEKEGLVPRSKLRDGKVDEEVQDLVKVGQTVKVWISEIDKDNRLTLSMTPNKVFNVVSRGPVARFKGYSSSEWLEGTVTGIQKYGAFVSITPAEGGEPSQGLVGIRELQAGFVADVGEVVKIGEKVKVRVLEVDVNTNRMALSMKPEPGSVPEPAAPSGGRKANLQEFADATNTWCEGVVTRIENYGAFVDVMPPSGGDPVSGLLHISQIKDGRVDDPAEELEVNQQVKVRILRVDEKGLSLSMKIQ